MAFNLFTDGGARGNPGPAACGFFLFDEKFLLKDFGGKYLGETTNNQAEYQGLLEGLKLAIKNEATEINVFMDSELIVKQLKGEYKVKDDNMKLLNKEVVKLLEKFTKYTVNHVPRSKNKFADKMVNVILDERD